MRRRNKNRKLHKKQKNQGNNTQPTMPKFENQLRLLGLKIRQITGDGNCLFRAVSDQLSGTEDLHPDFRILTVDHMVSHRDDFEPFIEDDQSFDKYIEKMGKDGAWGGNLELQAISQALEMNIHIHVLDAPIMKIENFPDDDRAINLSFHHGNHYNSVRMINDNPQEPAIAQKVDFWKEAVEFVQVVTEQQDPILVKKFLTTKFSSPPSVDQLQADSQNIAQELSNFQYKAPSNNSKCWCGSNRKYKKCCKRTDQLLTSNRETLQI